MGFQQISSVRDISMSSVDNISRNSSGRRLLRLCLTDGHSEITAIEYTQIPFLPDNVVPGTKVICHVSLYDCMCIPKLLSHSHCRSRGVILCIAKELQSDTADANRVVVAATSKT
jgi:hypothetical protein